MSPSVPLDLSVVIPIHNEAPNLEALYREFTDTLTRWGRPYELILVDDGSSDGSVQILERIQAADARVRVIELRRNFGQTAAFSAGFDAARGRLIATADGDLQNDPSDLPAMIARIESGYDIVCGWRKHRKDSFLNRRLPSMLANKLISWSTGVKLNDYGCSLKVFRAEVIKPLRLYGEMHRFLPALASEMGVRIAEQAVNHRARVHGASKYGISRTVRVMFDLLTVKFLLSYSTRPLQVFGPIGLVIAFTGSLIGAWLIYQRVVGMAAAGWLALLFLSLLLVITGGQLVTLGLLAELQARTYHESQGKPIYVIRRTLQDPEPSHTPES